MATVTLTADASNSARIAKGVGRKIGIAPASASAAQVKTYLMDHLNALAQDDDRLTAVEAQAAAATPLVQT